MIRQQTGLTLLEMIIVITILASLTVVTTQSIRQGIRTKAKIQEQIDQMSRVRDALKIMERDINLAFHYRDLEKEFRDEIRKSNLPPQTVRTNNLNQAPPPPVQLTPSQQAISNWYESIANPNRMDPTTQFVGAEKTLAFSTLNSGRMNENQLQADFIKVGYELSDCLENYKKEKPEGKCLYRRMSPVVEGDITKGGDQTLLLENISEFKLRYIGKGKQDWNDRWDTINGDAATKNNFPDAVEISLTVEFGKDKTKKKISMQIVAPIRFTNNKTGNNPS